MTSPAAPHDATAVDPRLARWTALAQRVCSQRLTRVIAPAGYDKTAFADHIAQTTTQPVSRVTFGYREHTLRRALELLVSTLGMHPDGMELPNLLAIDAKIGAGAYAQALTKDMSHPDFTGRVIILDNIHLLNPETAAVLVRIATADPLRCHVLASVRHPDEFPARELWGVPSLDLTERELAYTPDELRALAGGRHDDPYGYPALAQAVANGLPGHLHMQRMLSVTDRELLNELARASLLPVWPLDDQLSRALHVRPMLVQEALAADLPVIRTDPTLGTYVPHPALQQALTEHLARHPDDLQAAHARLAAYNANKDPVLAVRHAWLAEDTDRAISIALEWKARPDRPALEGADPLLLELLPFEAVLPGQLRLLVADAVAQTGRTAEAIRILQALRAQPDHAPDAADADEVALTLARVYATTGAYDRAYEELRSTAEATSRPYVKAFAALLLVRMHARGSTEFKAGESVLDVAQRWSEWVLKELRGARVPLHADADLMAMVVQMYLNHWAERSLTRLKIRLNLLILQDDMQTPEAGGALLLLHRLLVDHGHLDLASAALEAARRRLHLVLDARPALHAAAGRAALRAGAYEDAVGSYLLARDTLNRDTVDRGLDAEITLMTVCALLCLPETPLPELWQAHRTYAQAAAFCNTPQHASNQQVLTDLCRLREARAGASGEKIDTILQRIRLQLPTLVSLRCETAPLALLTVAPTESRDRALHTERTWQVQEVVRSLGAAAVQSYREAISPEHRVLTSYDLRVQLIGTPVIELDGEELRLTPQQTLLIAYLAVNRGYVSNDDIANAMFLGGGPTTYTALSRLRNNLQDRGIKDFIGQLTAARNRHNQYTIRHHRITLDLDQYGEHNPAAFWRSLGPRGLANLMSGHDAPWADQLRAEWALRCPKPVQGT